MDEPTEPIDEGTCMLLGPTALLVQAIMGVIVLLSLVLKRHREKPKRPWKIWMFDVSKQVAGQIVVHILNVGMSALVSQPDSGNNPCTAYFMNVTFDVTLGVVIIWAVLHGLTSLLTDKFNFTGLQSGSYGKPPSFRFWGKQTAVYVFALFTMKVIVLFILTSFPSTLDAGDWLLSWTGGNIRMQEVFVLGIYPIFMNILQFWLIDSIVKASSSFLEALDVQVGSSEADRRPLVGSDDSGYDDDDEDGSDSAQGADDIEHQKILSSRSSARSLPRPILSPRRTSSEAKSFQSSKAGRSRSNKGGSPLHLDTQDYDYPPPSSRRGSPSLPEPSSSMTNQLRHPTPRRRSPPPSPSPINTPNGYGSTAESPKLKPQSGNVATEGWEWGEDPDQLKSSATAGVSAGSRPLSPRIQPARPRKESWSMSLTQSPQGPASKLDTSS